MIRHIHPTAAVVLVALLSSSCSKGEAKKPVFPVEGQLFIDDKAAANATIIFHPVDESLTDGVKPRATVGKDGSFKLTTYTADDGAPAGEYRVTIEWWLSNGKDDAPTNRLNIKFSQPD